MSVIIRQYALLNPLNWDADCQEHLWLMNKLWNRLVEIEWTHRERYRAIMGSDAEVAAINRKIVAVKERIIDLDVQRKEARKIHRAKTGSHTEPFDLGINRAKEEMKALVAQSKEVRTAARERIKELTTYLEPERREAVKKARQESGLFWSNYNGVIASYIVARKLAIRKGTEIKFHRFDGSGQFHNHIRRGSTARLLAGKLSQAKITLVSNSEFASLAGKNPPASLLQSAGSRRDQRQYGLLAITVYTERDQEGNRVRRNLEFPIILHRPLPEDAILKEVVVVRKRVGAEFEHSAAFVYTTDMDEMADNLSGKSCRVKLGWKAVSGGLQVASVYDGQEVDSIVLPQVILDTLIYVNALQARIDKATNELHGLLVSALSEPPEILAEALTSLKQAKRPHPERNARVIFRWKDEAQEFNSTALDEADRQRKAIRRLKFERDNLQAKVLRRREDFYRKAALSLASVYGKIVLDPIDLSRIARLERHDGSPTELAAKARWQRSAAAVSTLRDWILKQAAKTGAIVDKATAAVQACSAAENS